MYGRTSVLRTLDRNSSPSSTPAVVRKKCQEIEDVAKKLRTRLREETDKNEDLSLQLTQMKQESQDKDKKLHGLNNVISELRNRLYESVEASLHDSIVQELDETKKKIKDLEEAQKRTSQTKKDYEDQLASLEGEVDKLKEQLKAAEIFKSQFEDANTDKMFFFDQVHKLSDKLKMVEEVKTEEMKSLRDNYEEKIRFLQEKLDEKENADYSFIDHKTLTDDAPHNLCSTFVVDQPVGESLGFFHEIKCSELEDEIKSLTSKYDEELAQLQQQLLQLQREKSQVEESLAKNLDSFKKETDALKSELVSCKEQMSSLKNQIEEKEQHIQEKETENKRLEKSSAEHLEKHKQLVNLLEQQTDMEKNLFKDQLSHLEKEMRDKDSQIESLKKEKDLLESQVHDLERGLEMKQSQLLRLEQQLREVVSQSVQELKGKEEVDQKKTQEILSLKQKILNNDEEIRRLEEENDEVVFKLTARLAQIEEENNIMKRDVEHQLEELKKESSNLARDLLQRNQDLLTADHLFQSLEKQVHERNDYISVLKGQLEHYNKTSSALETTTEELNQQLAQKTTQVEELWEKLIEADGVSNQEKEQLQYFSSRSQELEVQVEQQQLLITELQQQLMDNRLEMEAEIASLKMRLVEDDTCLARVITEKDSTIKGLEGQLFVLKHELENQKSMALEEQEKLKNKFEGNLRSKDDVTERFQEEIRDIRKSCSENHVKEIQRLREEIARINSILEKKTQQITNGMEEIEMMETSFKMERLQKERYQKECIRLEAQLDKFNKMSGNPAKNGNNTYIMPTINVHSRDAEVAGTIVRSIADNMSNAERPCLPSSSFFISEEPSEVMNVSSVSGKSSYSNLFSEEDPQRRLAQLTERNARRPPALKCSYAAELQELKVDDSAFQGLTARTNCMPGITVTETTTRQIKVISDNKRSSPLSRSVFRRVKGSWSPRLNKPKCTEIPD